MSVMYYIYMKHTLIGDYIKKERIEREMTHIIGMMDWHQTFIESL